MNYLIYKALNNLANGTTNFNTTVGAVGTAILAVNPNADISVQGVMTQCMGAFNGWTNNITFLGDGAFATAYPNVTNSTAINFQQTAQWKYINANTALPGQVIPSAVAFTGDVTVSGSDPNGNSKS